MTGIDEELHNMALNAALRDIFHPNYMTSNATKDMNSAIATYLRTAGLTVVPVEPTEEMIIGGINGCGMKYFKKWSDVWNRVSIGSEDAKLVYTAMLSAFPSPFKEEDNG